MTVEVFVRSNGREIRQGRTRAVSGFSGDAVQNCIGRARTAPTSEELNKSLGGLQSSGHCGLSHRFAKYRQRVDGLRVG